MIRWVFSHCLDHCRDELVCSERWGSIYLLEWTCLPLECSYLHLSGLCQGASSFWVWVKLLKSPMLICTCVCAQIPWLSFKMEQWWQQETGRAFLKAEGRDRRRIFVCFYWVVLWERSKHKSPLLPHLVSSHFWQCVGRIQICSLQVNLPFGCEYLTKCHDILYLLAILFILLQNWWIDKPLVRLLISTLQLFSLILCCHLLLGILTEWMPTFK